MQQKNQKYSDPSLLHIQEKAHSKRKLTRVMIQIFVWFLVISFIATIGVTWDGDAQGFPVIIKTKNSKIDLSPRSLFSMERTRLDQTYSKQYTNLDPRIYWSLINQEALKNTEQYVLQKDFFNQVQLFPSTQTFNQIKESVPEFSKEFVDYQYGMTMFFGDFSVLSMLGTPAVADYYAFEPLLEFTLASEVLLLDKTNFLASKITMEEKEEFYQKNLEMLAEKIVVTNFILSNRAEARKFTSFIKDNGVEGALQMASTNKTIQVQKNIELTGKPETYSLFKEVLSVFKNKNDSYILSKPMYNNGSYIISYADTIGDSTTLSEVFHSYLVKQYMSRYYKQLEKKYNHEWKKNINSIQQQISENISYSAIRSEYSWMVHHITTPFTIFSTRIFDTIGRVISVPLLENTEIFQNLLDTPLLNSSDLINIKENQQFIAVRPLERILPKNDDSIGALNKITQEFSQNIFLYKGQLLQRSFSENMDKRYKLKVYPDVLTNYNDIL